LVLAEPLVHMLQITQQPQEATVSTQCLEVSQVLVAVMGAHQIALAQEETPAMVVLVVVVGTSMALVQERLGKDLMAEILGLHTHMAVAAVALALLVMRLTAHLPALVELVSSHL
jgi:hypothetical protein